MRHWHRRLDMLKDKDKDGQHDDQGEMMKLKLGHELLGYNRCVRSFLTYHAALWSHLVLWSFGFVMFA